MSFPYSYGHLPATERIQLPVPIDYPAALALRQMALVQEELPKYLLAPEVSALLHYVPDLHRRMLLSTLWNSGVRINEALALTRADFNLASPIPFVQLATLKQRTEADRAPAGSTSHRIVPLSDSHYVSQLEMMVAQLKIPLERRNKRSGRRCDLFRAGDPAYVPAQLCHAHAVRRHPPQDPAALDGAQIRQLDGGIYESLCSGCRRTPPRPV